MPSRWSQTCPGAADALSGRGTGRHPPRRPTTLLTAGARTLQAWRVRGSAQAFNPPELFNLAAAPAFGGVRVRGLSAHVPRGARSLAKPGHAEWQSGCGHVAASVETDQRYMDVAGSRPSEGARRARRVVRGAVTAMALERGARDALEKRERTH